MREWTPKENPYAAPRGLRRKSLEAFFLALIGVLSAAWMIAMARLGWFGCGLLFFVMIGLGAWGIGWIYG